MMARNRRALYVLVPGVPFLAWRIYLMVAGGVPAPAAASGLLAFEPPPATSSAMAPADARPDPRWERQAIVAAEAWSRDPFSDAERVTQELPVQPTERRPDPPALTLTGISDANGQKIAILSGKLVKKGTLLEGDLHVTDIGTRSVTLRRGGWEFEFRIGQPAAQVRAVEGIPKQ